jgi:hypothetical protein
MPFAVTNPFPWRYYGNPDLAAPEYQRRLTGVYEKACGIGSLLMGTSHDTKYVAMAGDAERRGGLKFKTPRAVRLGILVHSFYALFHELEPSYLALLSDADIEDFNIIRLVAWYDYYFKDAAEIPNVDAWRGFVADLVAECTDPNVPVAY